MGKELTKEQKKILRKSSNSTSTQLFISNTLNARSSCIQKFLNWWKCRQSVEKWL